MTARPLPQSNTSSQPLPRYDSILLAVDASDHSNRAISEALALAGIWGSRFSATHVYAAKLHDRRFRQMEGGLPEHYQKERELQRQREVHDDLITKGLNIITGSYLDQVEKQSAPLGIELNRRALEGKNYRELTKEANGGGYDLLVLGALGLGAVKGSRIGTVCQRVTRRSRIDTLIIKEPARSVGEDPIVVAADGSAKSYGGLLTALALAKAWQVPVKVVSAFDPYYHYVAFNRIAGVLSEEAGKVFKFQEQEQLHEEIIDSGLAKIYQGHLAVCQQIAEDHGVEIETALLDGKPHDVINKYLKQVKPSLLVMGMTGIHADAELDIGGNTEALLRDADCALLLSQREYQPEVDRLAAVTTAWTEEAEARMGRVPGFVRAMARMAILRHAQEHGHTVITESLVEEATAKLMPGHAAEAMAEIVEAHDKGEIKGGIAPLRWSPEATRLLLTIKDLSLRGNLSMRAEKKARAAGSDTVAAEHIAAFLETTDPVGAPSGAKNGAPIGNGGAFFAPEGAPTWQAAALARLMRVPEGFMRDKSKERIETYARQRGLAEITLQTCEAGLAAARKSMEATAAKEGGSTEPPGGQCPFGHGTADSAEAAVADDTPAGIAWEQPALERLAEVPLGDCRNVTRKAVETLAAKNGLARIDLGFFTQILGVFAAGAATVQETMEWEPRAHACIARAPDMVRGMLIREIEGWAKRHGLERVDSRAVNIVKNEWRDGGLFHLDPDDTRNRG